MFTFAMIVIFALIYHFVYKKVISIVRTDLATEKLGYRVEIICFLASIGLVSIVMNGFIVIVHALTFLVGVA